MQLPIATPHGRGSSRQRSIPRRPRSTSGYTEVKAPFDGIVTARLVSLGELVGANAPTQLATIVQTAPIYVNFNINEQETLNIRADMRRLGITPEELKQYPIEVGLQTDQGYPYRGTLNYHRPGDRDACRARHLAESGSSAGAGQFRARAGWRP
jgi:multidrug efflux pump subunit AcrA (membrane-fusion protein)